MAGKSTSKVVEWADVIDRTSSDSGIPKKQIDDTIKAVVKGIEKTLEEKQPKRDGDSLEIKTPMDLYRSEKLPEQIVTDASGTKYTIPSRCAVNTSVPSNFVIAANVGLCDQADVDKLFKKA